MGCTASREEEEEDEYASRNENNKSPSTESTFGVPKQIGGDDPFGQRVSSNPLFRASAVSANVEVGDPGEITATHELVEERFTGFGSAATSSSSLIPAEPEPSNAPKSKADVKKERDLAGLAEKRKEERAAKLAAMKAKRAAKKTGDEQELNDALAIIDNLFE